MPQRNINLNLILRNQSRSIHYSKPIKDCFTQLCKRHTFNQFKSIYMAKKMHGNQSKKYYLDSEHVTKKNYKLSSLLVSFIEIPEDDGIWLSGFLLLAFFLDFPEQEKQPILVPLSLSLQRVQREGERGKIRLNTAWERVMVSWVQGEGYSSMYHFIPVSFCSCALLSCRFMNGNSNFLYSL